MLLKYIIAFFSILEEKIGMIKNFILENFLMKLHVLECPKYDLTIFGKSPVYDTNFVVTLFQYPIHGIISNFIFF